MVQVNTSGEEQKSGVAPAACLDLSRYIINECPRLTLTGLMTIGKYDESAAIFFEVCTTRPCFPSHFRCVLKRVLCLEAGQVP
jgi:uncharacterized pyridoxal phosphate-containing UPF0001 family protein